MARLCKTCAIPDEILDAFTDLGAQIGFGGVAQGLAGSVDGPILKSIDPGRLSHIPQHAVHSHALAVEFGELHDTVEVIECHPVANTFVSVPLARVLGYNRVEVFDHELPVVAVVFARADNP